MSTVYVSAHLIKKKIYFLLHVSPASHPAPIQIMGISGPTYLRWKLPQLPLFLLFLGVLPWISHPDLLIDPFIVN